MTSSSPITDVSTLRVSRPTTRLTEITEMYRSGLGFATIGHFKDDEGFDGVILRHSGHAYHLEFTATRRHLISSTPTAENVLAFYIPDARQWDARCARMISAGFRWVPSFDPYWDVAGRTFEDLDGYRVVLQRATWVA
jgi:hypothetical protein